MVGCIHVIMVQRIFIIHNYIHLGDRLVNNTGKLNRSRNYKEEREMYMREIKLKGRFYFLTKCWSPELREYLSRIMREDRRPPDVIVVLSCLWDMNRYI